ncbi:MAG: hypothetical protein CL928_04850 [Deltaproteobacteria bacterium]|nr:hypothetical protein [Deltaproteobacteria bacterium]|tara:strand:+ start:835 stop:1317 length:483 start_codon:yes stop_codon:yes gene_type:complete
MNTLAVNLDQVQGMLVVVVLLGVFCGGCHLVVKLRKRLDKWFFEQPYAQKERAKELKATREDLGTVKAELKKLKGSNSKTVALHEHNRVKDAKKTLQNKYDDLAKQVKNLKSKLDDAERTLFEQEVMLKHTPQQHSYRPPSVQNGHRNYATAQGGLGSGF